MKIIKADIEGSEICKGTEVAVIYSEPILGIMDGDDIPEWLLIEVLIRLPVKLIFRLKLVCKHWLSVISDPSFVRLYVSRVSLLRPLQQPWVIVSRVMFFDRSKRLDFLRSESVENIYSRELGSPRYCLLPLPSTQKPQLENFEIYGISNGLVLCASIVPKSDASLELTTIYNICNPVNGQRIVLPQVTCQSKNVCRGFLTQVEDGMLKSYRVVCLDRFFPRTCTVRLHVFSSESGEWKDFSVCSDQQIESMWAEPRTHLHGNLHWVFRNGILAYDPYEKPDDLRIIPLPRDKDQEHNQPRKRSTNRLCGVSYGKLRYLELSSFSETRYGFSSFSVWILNDYSSGDWSLQNKISNVDFLGDVVLWCPNRLILPIAFDPNDSDIVYLGCVNVISISYNIKTKIFEAHGQPLSTIQIVNRIRQFIDLDSYFGRCNLPFWFGYMFPIPPWPTWISPPSETTGE